MSRQLQTSSEVERSRRPISSRQHPNWWSRRTWKREMTRDRRVAIERFSNHQGLENVKIERAHRVGEPKVLNEKILGKCNHLKGIRNVHQRGFLEGGPQN